MEIDLTTVLTITILFLVLVGLYFVVNNVIESVNALIMYNMRPISFLVGLNGTISVLPKI